MQSALETNLLAKPTMNVGTELPSQTKRARYTCICCRVKFDSVDLQKHHFKTEWHTYNLKRKVCHLEPIDWADFLAIQATNQNEDSPKNHGHTKDEINCDFTAKSDRRDTDNQVNDDEWDDVDENELLDEDYTDEEVEEMLTRVIKNDTCLFCNLRSSNIKRNIDHMNASHGFFIPEEKYLIDLEGMLEYLGFKVGAGATCLWCDKQFTTLHGAQLHMQYKDHCKICYDEEKASEFKEFYDYAEQEHIPMKPLNELVISRKARPSKYFTDTKSAVQKHSRSQSKHLLIKASGFNFPVVTDRKQIKKFNAFRAKTLLRTQMANNNTMRGRIRIQNPM